MRRRVKIRRSAFQIDTLRTENLRKQLALAGYKNSRHEENLCCRHRATRRQTTSTLGIVTNLRQRVPNRLLQAGQ